MEINILTILHDDKDYVNQYLDLYMERRDTADDITLVEWFKNKLGKQNYCVNLSGRRFWVWERNELTVFINNIRGICLDVPYNITKERAKKFGMSSIRR